MARHILLVEDEPSFVEALTYWLEDIVAPPWVVTALGTLQDALDWLRSHRPTLILLDLNLPDSKELATFDRMWAACQDIPIVVVTALKGAYLEGNIIAQGAVWYLDKMYLAAHMDEFLRRLETFAEGPAAALTCRNHGTTRN